MPKNPILPLVGLLLLCSLITSAQSYQWAAGLKLSKSMGLSVVYSPGQHYSFEGIISKNLWTNESGVSLTGRYHHKIITRGLNFYGGGGLHYGMYEDGERGDFGGLLLQGGAEISLGKTNLSFNLTPLIGVGSENMKFRIGSDVTIRHILKKQPREKHAFLQKLGIVKSDKDKKKSKRKKNQSKKKSKSDFWDFEWLKKEG